MNYKYYYNNVPGVGQSRNNLIYTSLISDDSKTFVQWYYNDTEYHKGQNQVVDPSKMEEKWLREVNYITQMRNAYPDLIPKIIKIDLENRKLFLEIDGPDFWECAGCSMSNYDSVLHKYSMHPSSYFVVDGRLKSINYFFTYKNTEPNISIKDVESHIYSTRQDEMRKHLDTLDIKWDKPQPWEIMDQLCWASFSTNYPAEFIERVKCIL